MKYLEYKIVEEVNPERFVHIINDHIRQGWEPQGNLLIMPRHDNEISDGFFQAMVRIQRDPD